jgi:hypothetical protein
MIDAFSENHLTILIKEMAISKANDIFGSIERNRDSVSNNHIELNETDNVPLNGKEKRKVRQSAKNSLFDGTNDVTEDKIGQLSLDIIVQALAKIHPELLDLESSMSVVFETCKLAFCTDRSELMWSNTVHAELERLRAEMNATGTTSNDQADSLLRNVRSYITAFEDPSCFATCCYMIQAKAKFLSYALQTTERISDEMKQQLTLDFFSGCCLDFAYRVTRYALRKNNVDDGIFSFGVLDDDADGFYTPIDLGHCSYTKIYLSCKTKRSDPIALLQEELPGSVGAALAQLWTLCGEEHYQRKIEAPKRSQKDVNFQPGNVDSFLAHLTENCLLICGLPFTNFDKKTEKKFLSVRRLHLMKLFHEATDVATSLDVAIMILYQITRNMVVSGPLLRGPVLALLTKERKVTVYAAAELVSLTGKLDHGAEEDSTSLDRLKEVVFLASKGSSCATSL